jgi:hypothetical protein
MNIDKLKKLFHKDFEKFCANFSHEQAVDFSILQGDDYSPGAYFNLRFSAYVNRLESMSCELEDGLTFGGIYGPTTLVPFEFFPTPFHIRVPLDLAEKILVLGELPAQI